MRRSRRGSTGASTMSGHNDATIAASAAASRALGYRGIGDLIEIDQLSPQRIVIFFNNDFNRVESLASLTGEPSGDFKKISP